MDGRSENDLTEWMNVWGYGGFIVCIMYKYFSFGRRKCFHAHWLCMCIIWTAQHRTTDWWHSFWHTSNTSTKSLKEKFFLCSNVNRLIFTSFRIGCMRWNCFNTYIHEHIHHLGAAKDEWKYTGIKTAIMSLKKIFSTTSDVSDTICMHLKVSCMR